jgi:hypothetical protein
MYFPDEYKVIYECPVTHQKYDPLVIDRNLTIYSEDQIGEWIDARNARWLNEGPINPEERKKIAKESAEAELKLVELAKKSFSLPENTLASVALEVLYHFLEWVEGKESRAED